MNINRLFQRTLLVNVIWLAVAVLGSAQQGSAQTENAQVAKRDLLISVTFKTDNPYGNSPLIGGPEPAAIGANRLFGAADIWNNLSVAYSQNSNPAWDNLVDNTGTPTDVRLSIKGTVIAVDLTPWIPNPDPLRSAFIAWNSWTNGGGADGPGESTSIRWKLTGLPPDTIFDMCVYGSVADLDRAFDMTIQGTKMSIPTFNSASSPLPSCVLFANLVSDARGTISGVASGVGDSTTAANEADWSGFQLVQVRKGRRDIRIGFQRSKP